MEWAGSMQNKDSLRKELNMSEEPKDKDSTDGERNAHFGCEYLESCATEEKKLLSLESILAAFWKELVDKKEVVGKITELE